jgi:hypothetical protein
VATIDLFSEPREKEGSRWLPELRLVRMADSNQATEKTLNTPRIKNHQPEAANAVTAAPVGLRSRSQISDA